MFRFEDPIYLWLLLIAPLLAVLRFVLVRFQRKKMLHFGDMELIRQLSPTSSKYRPFVKFWLLMFAVSLIIVMIARPQFGTRISNEKREGIEAIICMDISNSMLSQDVVPSRLEKSKLLIEDLVDHFHEDKIGLVVFAGDAFVQLPITGDYVSAKMFLDDITPSLIQSQGTDIGQAVHVAMHSFTKNNATGKAIIIITDGEDHEGGAEEAVEKAQKAGINVFVLGIGSSKGAPIPLNSGEYLKDKSGNTVMTHLDENMCRQLAKAGRGTYIHVDNSNVAEMQLDREISKLQKGDMRSVIYSDYDEQFQAVGIIVLILLILEVLILEAKNPIMNNWKIFNRKKDMGRILFMLIFILCTLTISAQTDRQNIREGNRSYRAHNYKDANTSYRKALTENPKNDRATYNLGCTLQRQKKDNVAEEQYKHVTESSTDKHLRSLAYYNMALMKHQKGNLDEAIRDYKNALINDPANNSARNNLVKAMKEKKRQKKHNNKQDNKQKQNPEKNKQDNNKDKDKQKKSPKKQPQQQQNAMSKQNAEQLLNAAQQKEKETQQRLKKAMQQPRSRNLDKNW